MDVTAIAFFSLGGSFFFVEIALQALPIFTIVFLRVFLGAVILILFLFITVLVAHYFTNDEKISRGKIIGVILGVLGVLILIGIDTLFSGSNKIIGVVAVLFAAISYAFAGIWGKGFRSYDIDPVVMATGQLICYSSILLPIMLVVNRPWNLSFPGLNIWAAVFGIALLSTALAYIIYFNILSSSGATNVLLVTFLVPVSAIILGTFVLSEVFSRQYFLGMLVIGTGLICIDGRLYKLFKGRKNAQKRI